MQTDKIFKICLLKKVEVKVTPVTSAELMLL